MDRLEGLGYSTTLSSKFDRGLIKLFSFFTEGTKGRNRRENLDVTSAMVGIGDRVKVSENLGATSVAPVPPVVTSLLFIYSTEKIPRILKHKMV